VHLAGFAPAPDAPGEWYNPALSRLIAAAPGWDDMAWLREVTDLPLIAKGIARVEDAARLMALGWDGLVLSTHGGRALDQAPPPLSRVAAMREALGLDCAILIDGSVRSGADVFKALALGAVAGPLSFRAGAALGAAHISAMAATLAPKLESILAECSTQFPCGQRADPRVIDAHTQTATEGCSETVTLGGKDSPSSSISSATI